MKIALAQIASEIGDIAENIQKHTHAIEEAARQEADLVIFPELSLTGYAPELARTLAMPIDDTRLSVFSQLSAEKQITIGIGLPVKTDDKPQIGLLLFEPGQSPTLSAKQYLHKDELPDFSPGSNYCGPVAGSKDIALAICYELSVKEHAEQANQRNATIYLSSTAKTAAGAEKASARLAKISQQYGMLSLFCNCVGICEGQPAGGRSAFWNKKGELVRNLNSTQETLLLVNTESILAETYLL